MAQTHTATFYHCVFSTKNRANIIPGDLQPRFWQYIGGIAREKGMRALRVGGTSNHAHVALHIPATITVAKAMQTIKSLSSKWINEHPIRTRFQWQDGYGAFTLGISHIPATIAYIDRQEEHHRKRTFEQEYLVFLKKHRVDIDERFLWG